MGIRERGNQVTYRETVCVDCSLPSVKGLPPLVSVLRTVDGETVKVLRHEACPSNAEEAHDIIKTQREKWERARKPTLETRKVTSVTVRDGKEVRTVIS